MQVLRHWKKKGRATRSSISKARRREKRNSSKGYKPLVRYLAPKVISIDPPHYRSELLELLRKLRLHFRDDASRGVLIDFRQTSHLVADGTLLLYAELNRLMAYTNSAMKLRCTEPLNDRASQVLKQVGIYRLCSNRSPVRPSREDVVHWQVVQGTVVDNTLCAPAVEGFQGRLNAGMIDELLGGLGEAMTNAIHHAYDDIRADELGYRQPSKDWWMFLQSRDGNLSVVFCDLGSGIPATLPIKRPNLWQRLVLRKAAPTDSDCIREAIVEGRTRTNLDGRGYGLGNIVEVVENVPTGVVSVFSNRGRYNSHEPRTTDYEDSILGTLIFWKVPLQSP